MVKAGQVWSNPKAREGDDPNVAVISVRKYTAAQRRKPGFRWVAADAKEVLYCPESEYGKRRCSAEQMDDFSFEQHFVLVRE